MLFAPGPELHARSIELSVNRGSEHAGLCERLGCRGARVDIDNREVGAQSRRERGHRRITPILGGTVRGLAGIELVGLRRSSKAGTYFMVQLRFETSAPEAAELQHALYLADGVREADRVRHTVYRVGSAI